jgi:hypothetical protein
MKRVDSTVVRECIEQLESRYLLAWVPIKNAGFEINPTSAAPIPYWSINHDPGAEGEGETVSEAADDDFIDAFEGTRVAQLTISEAEKASDRLWIAQTLTTTIAAQTTYTLNAFAYSSEGGKYQVEIVAGGVVLAAADGGIGEGDPYPHTITVSYRAPDDPAQVNQPITLRLITTPSSSDGTQGVVQFDSVIMDQMDHGADDGPSPATYTIDLVAGGLSEAHEMNPGLSLAHNNDFDEENRNSDGIIVDDTQLNAASLNVFNGNRITNDEEFKIATLHIDFRTEASPPRAVRWKIDYSAPNGVHMWQWWYQGNANKPWPHWGLVTSGFSRPDGPGMRIFRVEGLRASQSVRDITVTATAEPVDSPGSATVSDSVAVTVNQSVAPPLSPTNLAATADGTGGVNLTWQLPAGAPAGIKYDVWRGTLSGFRLEGENTRFPERVNRIGIGMTEPNFSDTGIPLAPGAYYYCVTAVVNGVDSTPSNEVTGIRGGGADFADLDVFEDRDENGTHDNSMQAEQVEAGAPTKFTLVADDDPTQLAFVLAQAQPTETIRFNFDATKFSLFHDVEQTQPIAANTALPISAFSLSGGGTATLYGAAAAAGAVTGGMSLALGSGGTFSAFVGGMLGEQAGSGTEGGGEDDEDGNQPLTERDNFNFFTDTLVIGFGGHTQSEGKTNPDTHIRSGAVWNVDKKAGVYEIGQFMRQRNYMVTLFPEDPGNDEKDNLALCGDGIIGLEKDGTRKGGALDFLVKAVNKQHPGQREAVRKVALFGYSHGGGSVEILAAFIKTLMEQNTVTVGNKTYISEVFRDVSFLWAGYIDAVDVSYGNGDTTGQLDPLDAFPGAAPAEAGAFFNIFQDGGLHGKFVTSQRPQGFPRVDGDGRDTEIDTEPEGGDNRWPDGLTHALIDNDNDRQPNNGANTVQELLLDHFDNYVIAPDGT